MPISLFILFIVVAGAFLLLILAVVIYHAFDEDKAATGKVKPGDSSDYSLKNIKRS